MHPLLLITIPLVLVSVGESELPLGVALKISN